MEARIDFDNKRIHFDEVIGHQELAEYLAMYFPEEIYGGFTTVVDGVELEEVEE